MESFAFFRQFRAQTLILILAMAGLVSAAVCLEISGLFQTKHVAIEDPRFLVARRPLDAGEPLGLLDFGLVTVAQLKHAPPAGALTDQDLDRLKGASLTTPVSEGDFLVSSSLRFGGSGHWRSTIPPGLLAYALSPSNAPAVRPGDRVDILLKPESSKESPIILLESAPVLEVVATEPEHSQMVVAVSQDDIELLEKAQQKGKLKVALRNPEDHPSRRRGARVKHLWRAVRKTSGVQIWSEEP